MLSNSTHAGSVRGAPFAEVSVSVTTTYRSPSSSVFTPFSGIGVCTPASLFAASRMKLNFPLKLFHVKPALFVVSSALYALMVAVAGSGV